MVLRIRLLIAISVVLAAFAPSFAEATLQQPPEDVLSPAERLTLLKKAGALKAAGDHQAAARIFEQLLRATPDHGELQLALGDVYLSLDRADDALPLLEKALEAGYGEEEWLAYTIAQVHAYVGDDDEALHWLERAYDAGFSDTQIIRRNALFQPLAEESRYARIVGPDPALDLSRNEGWRIDIEYLAEELVRLHAGLDGRARSKAFHQSMTDLADGVEEMDDHSVLWELRRLVATLGDGHTAVYAPSSKRVPIVELPLTLYFFGDALHVIDASDERLIGSRVLQIGGRSTERIAREIERYISRDNPQGARWLGPYYLTFPSLLREMGYATDVDRATLTLLTRDGETVTREFKGEPKRRWRKLLAPATTDAGPVPLYLQHPDANFWVEALADLDAVYVQFNTLRDTENESLADFADRIGDQLAATGARDLIVDLRRDNGGNSKLVRPLLRRLIAFEMADAANRIFVVTGRTTFSACQSYLTRIERYTDAIFVGEPSSSSPNFVGEETEIRLPYSGTPVSISTIYWQDSSPKDRRRWIEPDVPVTLTVDDYFANRDPALKAIHEIIQTRR